MIFPDFLNIEWRRTKGVNETDNPVGEGWKMQRKMMAASQKKGDLFCFCSARKTTRPNQPANHPPFSVALSVEYRAFLGRLRECERDRRWVRFLRAQSFVCFVVLLLTDFFLCKKRVKRERKYEKLQVRKRKKEKWFVWSERKIMRENRK